MKERYIGRQIYRKIEQQIYNLQIDRIYSNIHDPLHNLMKERQIDR